MKEALTTGPAVTTEADTTTSRKITIEVSDNGKINLELSHAFKTYEMYGILATTFIDIFMKNNLVPIISQSTTAIIENNLDLSNQLASIISSNLVNKTGLSADKPLLKEIQDIINRHG